MYRLSLMFLLAGTVLWYSSCKSNEEKIIGKWQVQSFENSMRDSFMREQNKYVDTLSVVDSSMAFSLGTYNLDSAKQIIRDNMAQQRKMEDDEAKQGFMDFHQGGTIIFENRMKIDSSKWELKDKVLILTALVQNEGDNEPQKDSFYLEHVSKDSLRLRMDLDYTQLYINLRPAKQLPSEQKSNP